MAPGKILLKNNKRLNTKKKDVVDIKIHYKLSFWEVGFITAVFCLETSSAVDPNKRFQMFPNVKLKQLNH